MERGIAAGLTPPAIVMRDVPDQAAAQMVADPAQSPLLDAFRRFPPAIPEAERAGLTTRATDAYVQVARPAFEKLRDFLGTRYLPACRQTTAAAALPDGPALYAYNVKWHTTTSLSPQQIHEIGLAEVKRIRAEMDKVIAAAGFTGSYQEFVHFLRTDPRFYFTDADALVSAYRDIAKRADPELAPLFGRLPQSPYGVKVVPEAAAPSQTTAYYEPGAFRSAGPATCSPTPTSSRCARSGRWRRSPCTRPCPGIIFRSRSRRSWKASPSSARTPATPPMSKAGASTRSRSASEMGFYKDPYSKFGQLTYEMWRAVRLVVDTGLHSMNWTRQQAIDFFMANAAKTEQDIIVEVDRYIAWPGQALGYKIGQMKIQELRAVEREADGRPVRPPQVPRRRARRRRGAARRARVPREGVGRPLSHVAGNDGTRSRRHAGGARPGGEMSSHARLFPALLVLGAALFQSRPATAQLFQWTPEQLIKYTSKNPYDRFPDGRPKVPDEMLERLKVLVAEEVQAVLPGRGFPNQFEPREGWKVLQPNQKMVGRVLTVQFMPARGDIIDVDEADAKAKGTTAARNQTAIDMLQPGDVIVADVFGAEWNFVGNKLAHYIQTTTKNGMIVDGGVYWLDRIAETGMQAYFKNSLPAQGMRVMVTGINIPVRIGKTLVMPGDVVLADREGMWFIPPQAVKDVVESGELSKARDDWSLMMLGTGKYTSRQIYGPLTPELQKMRDDYVFQKTGRRPAPEK